MISRFIKTIFLIFATFNLVYSLCNTKKKLLNRNHREMFMPTSANRCTEISIGPYSTPFTYTIVFNNSMAILNCTLKDNIIVYDENRNLIIDYCEVRQTKQMAIVTKVAKNIYIEYLYASNSLFTVGFEWFVLPISNITTQPFVQCGKPQVQMSANGIRIVNGAVVVPYSHPWQVFVDEYCGGAIISNQWVLTAAHCLPSQREYHVYAGLHDLNKDLNNTVIQKLTVSKIYKHPSYNLKGSYENDIALLKLKTPINYTKEVSPICLPTRALQPSTIAIVTGWGRTNHSGDLSNELRQTFFSIRNIDFCQTIAEGTEPLNSTFQICAGNTVESNGIIKDTCQGDSGGPLITSINDRYYLSGLVSYGARNDCNGLGIYANVFGYLNWINSIMKN